MEIKIRDEDSGDIEQVRKILRAAFPTDAESRLNDERVLGHILFSPVATTPPSEAKGLGLAPVAVRPEAQSKGIGSQLIYEGLRLCKELGFDYCVVLGDPKYYQRFGFEKASPFGIRNEYGVDNEFMVICFSDRGVAGVVQYANEFSLFSV